MKKRVIYPRFALSIFSMILNICKVMQKKQRKNILMVVTFLCSRLRVKLVKKNKQIPLRLLLAVEQK